MFLTANSKLVDRLGSEMLEETDVPLTWYEVLLYLRESPDQRLRMHELADSLLLSRSAATRFIDRMQEAGLVERTTCDDDRRGTYVAMTDRGREAFSRAAPVHLAGIDQHFARLIDAREATVIGEVMERILAALEPGRRAGAGSAP
jgi:DNA-binding MarR family transcriptional regulator